MAQLFGKDRTVITRHIHNIFKEQELYEKSNVQKMHVPNFDKIVGIYSFEIIISVGYILDITNRSYDKTNGNDS